MEPETPTTAEPSLFEKVTCALKEVGRELDVSKQLHLKCNFEVTLQATGDPRILITGTRPKCWDLNSPLLTFMLNGRYYSEYNSIFGTMGLPAMHHTTWEGLVEWVGKHVEKLALWSCDQVRAKNIARGDKDQWQASYDLLTKQKCFCVYIWRFHISLAWSSTGSKL